MRSALPEENTNSKLTSYGVKAEASLLVPLMSGLLDFGAAIAPA